MLKFKSDVAKRRLWTRKVTAIGLAFFLSTPLVAAADREMTRCAVFADWQLAPGRAAGSVRYCSACDPSPGRAVLLTAPPERAAPEVDDPKTERAK